MSELKVTLLMKTNAVNCSVNDYDFYTIPLPVKTLLHRQKDRYIGSQLEKLHPCFSDDCSFDSHLSLGKKGLNADVVVMQKYKVAEYKALYKRMFVQERKHIQFFAGNKCMRRGVVAVVGLLMLVFALVFFSYRKPCSETS